MKAQSKKIKNLISWMALILITIIVSVCGYFKTQEMKQIANLPLELRKALEYGELQEEDYKTQSEGVEFSAFFSKDLNGDGYAERVKGTAVSLNDEKRELYAELNVSKNGNLEDGIITFNCDNFYWSSTIIADSVVSKNYVGSTSIIELQHEVNSGSQKLFIGTISPKIGNNINDFSKVNSITLTGTYVDEDGNRTSINVTRNLKVDWYGYINTVINSNEQSIARDMEGEYMKLRVNLSSSDEYKNLIIKENVMTAKAPELNGYKAIGVIAPNGVQCDFDEETGIVTITNSSEIDENGNITKSVKYVNNYEIKFVYPIDANGYLSAEDPTTYNKIEVPVTAKYVAYNNQSEGFTNILESSANDIINLITDKTSTGIYRVADVIIGGESYHDRRVISKEKALNYYKGIEEEDPDEYKVRWRFESEKDFDNLVVEEEKPDEALNKNGISTSLEDVVSYKGIYFGNGFQTTDIKVYDADTDELLCSFDKATDAPEANAFMYDRKVKHVRVEVGKIHSGMSLTICHIKEIDDKAMTQKFTKEQFDDIKGIYSYLYVIDNNRIGFKTSKFAGFAQYNELESEVKMDLSNTEVNNNNELIPQTITIRTISDDWNQMKWRNGEFLVKFPKNIIYANIESVSIDNSLVNILGYDLYKKDGVYFAKVITSNYDRAIYNLTINCNMLINPITPTTNEKFVLYAYNEDCHKYYLDIDDTYDVNDNNDVLEKVGTYSVYMKMNAPSTLLTSQSASNYDDEGSVTIAPNIADVNQDKRTVDISVNILNNYEKTIDEIKVLGTIPFEGNKYIKNNDELGSEFSSYMTNDGIRVSSELQGKVTIYYSENIEATNDLDDENNKWTTTPEDFSKVRRYLIDFGNNLLPSGQNGVFTYTVEIPKGIEYNRFSYSTHMLYFAIETEGGKLLTQVESSRLGIRMARKYDLDIDKFNSENHKPVAGAVYKLVELDDNNQEFSSKLVTTNENGKLIVKDLYVDRKYTLEEIKNPSSYMLNRDKIEFITRENAEFQLEIEVLSEDKFKTGPTIESNVVNASVEDEPKYQVLITKKDKTTKEKLSGVQFDLSSVNDKNVTENEKYITDKNGELILKNLERDREYTLKEIYADGYYLLDDIVFKLVKENGEFKISSEDEAFANANITIEPNEDLIKVELDVENNKQPSILINKIDSKTQSPIEGVRFTVQNRLGKTYITDAEGKTLINGFAENEQYTIEEIKADGYYLQNITFTIVRDSENKLKVNSDNEEFRNAVVIDEARKILSVTLPNEKIPNYKLKIQKVDELDNTKALQGARFQLVGQDNDTINEYTTDENGIIEVPNLYKYVEGKYITGNYILKELESPSGYSNNVENIEFRVNKISQEESNVEIKNLSNLKTVVGSKIEDDVVTLIIKDKPLFTLLKIDSQTKLPLANAKFVIMKLGTPIDYAKDVNGNYIGTQDEDGKYVITTDDSGRITLALPNGKYMIIEVGFPEGYKEKDIVEFIEINDGTTGKDDDDDNIEYLETINNIEDLVMLSKQVNSGIDYSDHKLTLARTLDFTEDASYNDPEDISFGDLNNDGVTEGIKEELSKGTGFTPIGELSGKYFSGIFDGNGNQIKNIFINYNNTSYYNTYYCGLFGDCKGAIIANLGITGNINTKTYTGAIAGNVQNTKIVNCYSNVDINGETYSTQLKVGGIVGNISSSSIIRNCYNTGNLNAKITYSGTPYVAGIAGYIGNYSNSKILNCYNIGNLNSNNGTTGTIVVKDTNPKSLITNNYYLNSIQLVGGTKQKTGASMTESTMKSDEFIGRLNPEAYEKDINSINNGYPVLLKDNIKSQITEIEYIEDLVELSEEVNYFRSGKKFEITLKNSLDFQNDESYRNPLSKYFGDLNGDGVTEGIKEELSKGKGFTPIGNSYDNVFSGTFEGNGYEIKNIYINDENAQYVGLFGRCEDSKILNLGISGNITGRDYAGGIVGYVAGSNIANCYSKANIQFENGFYYIGGIAGNVEASTIKNCYNTGNLNGTATDSSNSIGGIVGYINQSKIFNCYNIGNVNSNATSGVIVGKNNNGTSILENNYYLNSIQIIGNEIENSGTSVTEEEMKSDEFIETLNSEAYTKDINNLNNGYPVLLKAEIKLITEIEYIEDLVELSEQVSYGNSYENVEITLKETLDFTENASYKNPESKIYGDLNGDGTVEGIKEELSKGKGFTPIGNYNSSFSGIFNGNNKEIKNIYINNNSAAGLFGYAGSATIKDLSITGNISGEYVGGFVGYIQDGNVVFNNCHNYANLTATSSVGGLFGYSSNIGCTIENCSNEGEITETSISNKGGLIGYYSGKLNLKLIIKNSFNKANIISGTNIGGLIGDCYASSSDSVLIENCYNEGNVLVGTSYAGGLIGEVYSNSIIIKDSYNKGDITSSGAYYLGGLVGYASGQTEIDNCYNYGNINASTGARYIGGILGYSYSSIKINNCHNKGEIISEPENSYSDPYIGGILGYTDNQFEIANCSNSGNITAKRADYVGGIVSYTYSSDSSLISNYNTGNIIVNEFCDYAAGISGYSQYNTRIENSYNTGDITLNNGTYNAGGISAYGGALNNIYNTGNIFVKANNSYSIYMGGISGQNASLVKNGYNIGNITVFPVNGYVYIGGIAGYPSGNIENVYNIGDISVLKNPNGLSVSTIYGGGIVGMAYSNIKNVYNSGKVTTNIPFSDQLYFGGIAGWDSSTVENAYNAGDIEGNWNEFIDGSIYIGGINGYNGGLVKDSINTGNIKYTMNGAQSSNEYRKVGGIAASGNAEDCYSVGNIELIDKSSSLNCGKILGTSTDSEEINYYSKDMITSVNSSSYFSVVKMTNEKAAEEIPLSRILDIKSVDFYNLINEDSVWAHLDGYLPKLLVGGAKNIDATQIEIANNLKIYNITTDVDESDGKKGGTITGEDETPFENVKHGEQNTKEIKMIPNNGYEISSITINGEAITFEANDDGSYTILPGAFININEDKHIVVKYNLAEQVLTINKVDEDDNTKSLSGAKFSVEKLKYTNELLGKMTANGTYYFEESNGTYMPNNIQVSDNANSYVPINLTNVSGDYYVVVNAEGYSGNMLATVEENTDPITNLAPYSTNTFMYVSGGSTQPQDYTSNLLQGGKQYYLKFVSTTWSPGAPSASRINSIRLFKKVEDVSECLGQVTSNNETRTFINDNGTIKLDGVNTTSQGANAYIEIDLTNKTGNYNVLMNMNAKMDSGYFAATIEDNTAAVSNYSPYDKYVYLGENAENRTYVTRPLEGGKKYYLQLAYTGGNPTNEININSVTLVKSSIEEWFVNETDATQNVDDENEVFGKIFKNTANVSYYTFEENNGKYVNIASNPSSACIEIDLTNKIGNYNALVDFSKLNPSGTFIAKIKKDSGLETDYSPYGNFIYVYETENGKTYSSPILKGGEKYYLHLISSGGANPKSILINSINLVKNTSLETFNNSNSNEIFGTVVNNGDYYFEYNNGKLIPNNNNEEEKLANSYIPINLSNKVGKYAVVIKGNSDYSNMTASISKNTDSIESISYFSNDSFMWVNGSSEKYGVYPEYTYVSEPLEGGEQYYLKLVGDSRKNDQFAEITDIQIIEYSQVEKFKNNKGDKFVVTDLITNEDGQIKLKVPSIGKYLITEIEAPEGYTLKNTPIVYTVQDKKDNSVTIENKTKQKVTVHHYLKDLEGNETTVKIAEDEVNIYDIGESYFTLPKVNLNNLELIKDENGEYIVPDNATGVVGDGETVVTYYYIVNPIKLTIHHYLDGTEEKLAEDKVVTYMPEINIEDNFVRSVELTQSYEIKSNADYNQILSSDYELTFVTKDKELIEDETFEFIEDTELEYYYKKAKGILNVNYLEYQTERQLLEPDITQDKIGKDYTVEIKPIEDYTFVERRGDLKGKFEESTKTVKLYYKQSAQVTVNHIDRDTNEVLDTKTYEGLVGDQFTSSSKNFTKYILVDKPENETVTMGQEEIILNYYYIKVNAGVLEKHIDIVSDEILFNELHEGDYQEEYNISPKTFEGYDLVEDRMPENASGQMGIDTIEVDYYYIAKTKVTAEYVNKLTGAKLTEDVIKNGHEGDNYTTENKTFEGYDLVKVPENAEGQMTKQDIVVTYEYKEISAGVIEKHIDVKSNEVLDTKTYEGYVGDNYITASKTIEGYDLVEDRLPENAEGQMTKALIEVDYYYIAKTKVTAEYVNKLTGEKLTTDVVKNGHEGDNYTTENKTFTGYDLVKVPENAEGQMTKQDIVVTYEYKEISAGVIEKHIDIKSNEVLDTKTYEGHVGDSYITASKTIEGYDLVEDRLPENAEGQMTKALIEVDYYYIAKTKVTAEYVNKLTGEKLTTDVIENGHEGDNYTTENKTFTGYDLIKVPENAEGQMTKQDIVVTYEYKEKSAGVIEKHIDIKSNEVLDTKTYEGYVGDNYIINPKTIEGYDLVEDRLPENSEGQMTKALIEVDYYYIAKTKVTAEYVNKLTGEKLTTDVIKNGHEGDNYTTENKTFTGYDLIKVPENASGQMTKQDIVVTYEYKEKSAGVIEKHIDVKSNEVLDTKTYEGHVGDNYVVTSKEFEGYDLVEDRLPSNAEGQMTKALIEVDYYYIAKTKVTAEYVNKLTGAKLTEDVIKNGHEGDNYTTENKTFTGYDLVKVPENAEGQMTKQDIVVTYEYKEKSAGVIEKHIDVLTNVVLDQKTYQGHVGDSYRTTAKQFTEYNLVEDRLPENAEGQMIKALIEVNYYYERKQGIVNVEYLEYGTTTQLKDAEVKKDRIGQSYTIEVPIINGYTYVEKNGDLQGEIELNSKTVKLYYKQNTKVIVNHIDKDTNEVMDTITKDGLVGDEFTSNSKTFDKYILVDKPENETVTMTKEPITLNYYYIKVSASVLEKHIDVISNEVLVQELHEGTYGESYNINARTISGYDLVEDRLPTNSRGTLGIDLIEVDYYYKKKAKVTVRLVDKITGEDIETPQELNLHQGDEYQVVVKQITGYDLVERPEGDKITINDDTTIVYYYKKKARVEARYIDKDTGRNLLDPVVIEGHEGDDYETEAKQIHNYNLLGTPQNYKGKMSVTVTQNAGIQTFNNTINVTYYYELAKGKVNVEYLEYGTGRKLLDKVTKEDKLGKAYSVEIPTIEGYTFVEKDGDLTGIFEENEKTVKLYYKQNAQVTVNHIDKQTNKVMATNTYKGLVGDEFTSTSRNFTRYVLVQKPANETITMTKEPITLNYYYSKVSGGVIEKHVDVINNEILANEVHSGDNGDEYDIKPRTFTNYDLVEDRIPVNAKGIMGVQPIEVIYYYISKSKVIVEYVNQLTGINLIDNIIKQGHEGDIYTTENKLFEGYKLVKVPTNANGKMTKDDIIVRYEYKEESAGVLEKHIDVITNNLLDQKTYQGYVGDSYRTTSKTFAGYDLLEDRLPKNSEGKMTKDAIEVDYYYKKRAKVIVRLVDKITGKDIEVPEELDLHQCDEYKVTVKEIEGYDIFEKPEGDKVMINNDTTIIYYYKKKAKVETRYVDKATGKDLLDPVVIEGHEGDTYETEAKEVKYYKLAETPKNSKGTMHVETLENNGKTMFNDKTSVIYYYRAEDFNLKVDKNITKVILDGEALKVSNGKLAKADVHRKKLNSSSIIVEYTLKVSNIGELAGGTTLKENIPEGFTFKEENDSPWKLENGIAQLKIEELKPGEEKEFKVTLEWNKGEQNLGTKVNTASITDETNEAKFEDSNKDDNESSATLIISIATGKEQLLATILIITILTIGVSTVIVSKKRSRK